MGREGSDLREIESKILNLRVGGRYTVATLAEVGIYVWHFTLEAAPYSDFEHSYRLRTFPKGTRSLHLVWINVSTSFLIFNDWVSYNSIYLADSIHASIRRGGSDLSDGMEPFDIRYLLQAFRCAPEQPLITSRELRSHFVWQLDFFEHAKL